MGLKYRILVSALFKNLNNEIDSSNLRFYRNVVSNEIFALCLDTNWELKNGVWDKYVTGVVEPISNSKLYIFPTIKPFYYNRFGKYSKYDDISLLEEYLTEKTFQHFDDNGGNNNYNFFYKGDYFQEIPEAFLDIDKGNSKNIKLRDVYKLYRMLNEKNIFENVSSRGL